jgi:hypothetical protein
MNYENILKHNGRYYTPTSGLEANIGDVVEATGWFASFENGQRKLTTVIQFVQEKRGDVIRVDGPAGSFECKSYRKLVPVTVDDVNRCRAALAESEALLAQGKRVGFGKNRGKDITSDFQRTAAMNSIAEQRQMLAEMEAQL